MEISLFNFLQPEVNVSGLKTPEENTAFDFTAMMESIIATPAVDTAAGAMDLEADGDAVTLPGNPVKVKPAETGIISADPGAALIEAFMPRSAVQALPEIKAEEMEARDDLSIAPVLPVHEDEAEPAAAPAVEKDAIPAAMYMPFLMSVETPKKEFKPETGLKAPSADYSDIKHATGAERVLNESPARETVAILNENKGIKTAGNALSVQGSAAEAINWFEVEIPVDDLIDTDKGTAVDKFVPVEPFNRLEVSGEPAVEKPFETEIDTNLMAVTAEAANDGLNDEQSGGRPDGNMDDLSLQPDTEIKDPAVFIGALSEKVSIGAARADAPAAVRTIIDVKEKLEGAIKVSVEQGGGEVRMKLNPESLGELTIKLNIEENVVTAEIVVESAEVKSILDTDSGLLKDALGSQGLTLDKYTVEIKAAPRDPDEQLPDREDPVRDFNQGRKGGRDEPGQEKRFRLPYQTPVNFDGVDIFI